MSTATDITFDAENHEYFLGMERIPAVSEILRPLTESYLAAIPEAILNWKRDLGIAVHKACELHDLGILDEESVDPEIRPYLEGYRKFLSDYNPKWLALEAVVFNERDRYAGTLDRVGITKSRTILVDLKTSLSIQPSAAVQLTAYADAYGDAPDELAILQLLKTGDYNYAPQQPEPSTWAALLTVHKWKTAHEGKKKS